MPRQRCRTVGDNGYKSPDENHHRYLWGGWSLAFNGQDITTLPPGERRTVTMIYQDRHWHAAGCFGQHLLGRSRSEMLVSPGYVDKARMDISTEDDRLPGAISLIHRPVGMFSGGQQQTVAIARSLTFNPKLVIMDEPTAALAVREVESVLNLIRQMRSEGIAVILISHRLNDVFEVTDRIVVLRQGRIEADLATAQTRMREVVEYIVGAH
jgi:ABC-type sugar transport system ATPase subunit